MVSLFILATLIFFIDPIASLIIKFIISKRFSESREDKLLRQELIAMKKEMNSISMVDEFARYAKLQRKYNKLEAEAEKKRHVQLSSRTKLRLSLTFGIRILTGILTAILLFWYRKEPVIVFPNYYLWPFESFLSWPTGVENCISLPTWIILMKLTSSYYKINVS